MGRHDELVDLSKVLHDARMVTITGTGGVGKTRVAVQLAAELLQRFPDGAWLFELAAVSDAEAMVQLVAATLSVPPRPGVSLEGAVLELLRSKRALVVLDNCEHLLDASGRLPRLSLEVGVLPGREHPSTAALQIVPRELGAIRQRQGRVLEPPRDPGRFTHRLREL